MKNSSTIIRKSFSRMALFIGGSGCQVLQRAPRAMRPCRVRRAGRAPCTAGRGLRELPTGAIVARQEFVGVDGPVAIPDSVDDAPLLAIVVDLPSGAQRYDAEQHHFCQTRSIFERTGNRRLALDGLDPVHLVFFVSNARELRLGGSVRVVQ